jgi:hypothetical protein
MKAVIRTCTLNTCTFHAIIKIFTLNPAIDKFFCTELFSFRFQAKRTLNIPNCLFSPCDPGIYIPVTARAEEVLISTTRKYFHDRTVHTTAFKGLPKLLINDASVGSATYSSSK